MEDGLTLMGVFEVPVRRWRVIATVVIVLMTVVTGMLMLGVSGESKPTAFAIVSGLDPL
jgi:hypothetical protein